MKAEIVVLSLVVTFAVATMACGPQPDSVGRKWVGIGRPYNASVKVVDVLGQRHRDRPRRILFLQEPPKKGRCPMSEENIPMVPPSFAEILDQIDAERGDVPTEGNPLSLADMLQAQIHDLVARVRKDGCDGKLSLGLLIERSKEGVTISGKWASTTVAKLGDGKAPGNLFRSKRYGQLELFNQPEMSDES